MGAAGADAAALRERLGDDAADIVDDADVDADRAARLWAVTATFGEEGGFAVAAAAAAAAGCSRRRRDDPVGSGVAAADSAAACAVAGRGPVERFLKTTVSTTSPSSSRSFRKTRTGKKKVKEKERNRKVHSEISPARF